MRRKMYLVSALFTLALFATVSFAVAQSTLGTGFTYQGFLKESSSPVNAAIDFEFKLYDASSGGGQVASTLVIEDQPVSNGLFTVKLDFGSDVFAGDARWLEIGVRPAAETGAYTTLSPRQELTAVPFAMRASSAPWPGRVTVPDNATITAIGSSPGAQGYRSSATIGEDGLALISHYDGSQNDLEVTHCNDIACTSYTNSTLDSANVVGRDSSITIGADGLGLISYYYETAGDLRVAHCDDIACTSATITTLDTTGQSGRYNSITIGSDGLGLISYNEGAGADLRVAHCDNVACTSATITNLDSSGITGGGTSIATGIDGLGLISYYDTSYAIKVAHCSNITCTAAALTTLDTTTQSPSGGTSLTIGADGLGLIAYQDGADLNVAHCDNVTCTLTTISTLDIGGSDARAGRYPAVTVGSGGLGLISYQYSIPPDDPFVDPSVSHLKVAHCVDLDCTGAVIATVDTGEYLGYWSSVTIGVDEMPLIAYWDSDSFERRVAHCSNAFCAPYFRRR